ncbi:MAG: DUF481 domain-containing protein [Bacteroidetes bacterium]|nr:DUF481 domain-containing protein [Bacteroidota bacterium]
MLIVKNKIIIIFFLICNTYFINSQVINIESKRFLNDTNGFVGKAEGNFNINQNISVITTFGINIHAQYKLNKHRFLAISDLLFIKAGQQDYVNSGYQHIRYNYGLTKVLVFESFIQAQYNLILKLNKRYLAGIGPRFKIYKGNKVKIFSGALYMYEYQVQNNEQIIQFNNRISSYVSLTLDFEKVDFVSTCFYQPKINYFDNYRFATDSSFEFQITNHFNFRVGINLLYDTRQPPGVPALTYMLKNAVGFKF